jgi:flavin-binding protein dodecin
LRNNLASFQPGTGRLRESGTLRIENPPFNQEENNMADSVYKIIELVGTSTESWEKAAAAAVERAAQSLRDLRVAEVVQLDMVIDDNKVTAYRAKLKVSFKYEGGG